MTRAARTNMDLRHLRYFQAIAEELSFSRAARRLNVVQPALSRALKELEAELGMEVIARTEWLGNGRLWRKE